MKDPEDIKEQKNVLSDEELGPVTGGIRVTPYATLILQQQQQQNGVVPQSDATGNNG